MCNNMRYFNKNNCCKTIHSCIVYWHSIKGFNNRYLYANSSKGKVLIDFSALCQYCSKDILNGDTSPNDSVPLCEERMRVSYANEATMDLQRDAPWVILQRKCFLNSSRATRQETQEGSRTKNGTEAFILIWWKPWMFSELWKSLDVQYMSSISEAAGGAACCNLSRGIFSQHVPQSIVDFPMQPLLQQFWRMLYRYRWYTILFQFAQNCIFILIA